jgi:hypothetical protein
LIRKAISIGVSAALLGSLLAVFIPGTALGASVSATTTAAVPRDGGYVGTASIKIEEAAVGEFPTTAFNITIGILDANDAPTVTFDTTASSLVLSPDSLDPSAVFLDARTLRVTVGTSNSGQLEALTIGGLKIQAEDDAALGAIKTYYMLSAALNGSPGDLGGRAAIPASGKLSADVPSGTTTPIPYTLDAGSPAFAATATPAPPGIITGPMAFAGANAESKDITAPGPPATLAVATAFDHANGTVITQTRTRTTCVGAFAMPDACFLPSIGSVVDSLDAYTSLPVPGVQRGLANSQHAANVYLDERWLGDPYLTKGAVVTLKLDAALGVKFSGPAILTEYSEDVAWGKLSATSPLGVPAGTSPIVVDMGAYSPTGRDFTTSPPVASISGGANEDVTITGVAGAATAQQTLTLSAPTTAAHEFKAPVVQDFGTYVTYPSMVCEVSSDRLTLTCGGLPAAGTGFSWVEITNIYVDVPTTATAGAKVDVAVTVGSLLVIPSTLTIARINNTADATADAPTVIIGENDQQSGTVLIREAGAGLLGSGAPTNVLRVCYASHETFTRSPWLVVTGGDLKLRTPSDPTLPGSPAAPGTGVLGQLGFNGMGFACAQWIVYTKSTVASTLEIRGSDTAGAMFGAGAAHGPQINVPHFLRPGPSILNLYAVGSTSWANTGTEFAYVVNAIRVFLATPVVTAVSKPEIFRGVPSQPAGDVTITETASHQFDATEQVLFSVVPNNLRDILPSVRFDTNRTTPVVSTNAASTGLIAHFQGYLNPVQFAIRVDQRAFVPVVGAWVPGVITVGSMKYTTTNDAAFGAVSLEVCTPALVASTGMIDFQTEALFGGIGLGLCFYRGLYGHDMGQVGVEAQQTPSHEGSWADFDQVVQNAKVVQEGLFPSMSVAAGYKFREISPYKTFGTLVVAKGTYITNKVYVGAQFQGTRIEFWQRNGKTGTWVKRTTGRVDGKGYAYWSTIPPKLGGTGFARYVYYRAYFAGTDTVAAAFSQTMNRVLVQ